MQYYYLHTIVKYPSNTKNVSHIKWQSRLKHPSHNFSIRGSAGYKFSAFSLRWEARP